MPRRGRGPHRSRREYPRTARLNELLRQVLADELERIGADELGLVTITGVTVDAELRHATVWMASLDDEERAALERLRPELQQALARQVRMKRTPELSFRADPAIESGERVEEILRDLSRRARR